MHIRAPHRLDRVEPLMSRRARRRKALWWMLGGSLLLHVLLLSLFIVFVPPQPPPAVEGPQADEVQMLFQPGVNPNAASSASDKPDAPSAVAAGNPAPAPDHPTPDPSTEAPTPVSAPAPAPTPPPPTPADQPIVEASIPQPAPEPPAPPAPTPPEAAPAPPPPTPAPVTPPRQAPTVSLQLPPDDSAPLLSLPPPFVPPQAPIVLPRPPAPPPRPAPPRVARVQPRSSPFALNAPSNWSFNAAPSAPSGTAGRHGFDTSVSDLAGQKDESLQYVRGAHPGADWEAKVHAWIVAHSSYPEQAASEGHEGQATVFLRVDRTGRVLSVQLISSAHEPFLDGAWVSAWRGGVVPPFPPGVTDDVAEFNYTVFYRLIRH